MPKKSLARGQRAGRKGKPESPSAHSKGSSASSPPPQLLMELTGFLLLVPWRGKEAGSPGVLPLCHSGACHHKGSGDTANTHGLNARPRQWKMNYVSFISKKQSQSPFVIKFAVRETLLYLITSDICWLLVLETIKV